MKRFLLFVVIILVAGVTPSASAGVKVVEVMGKINAVAGDANGILVKYGQAFESTFSSVSFTAVVDFLSSRTGASQKRDEIFQRLMKESSPTFDKEAKLRFRKGWPVNLRDDFRAQKTILARVGYLPDRTVLYIHYVASSIDVGAGPVPLGFTVIDPP